jgi:hypothetical protein
MVVLSDTAQRGTGAAGFIYRHSTKENDLQVLGNRVLLPVMVAILPHVRVHRIMQKIQKDEERIGFGWDLVWTGSHQDVDLSTVDW